MSLLLIAAILKAEMSAAGDSSLSEAEITPAKHEGRNSAAPEVAGMYVCMYVCMYIHHIYIYARTHIHMYIYIYTYSEYI